MPKYETHQQLIHKISYKNTDNKLNLKSIQTPINKGVAGGKITRKKPENAKNPNLKDQKFQNKPTDLKVRTDMTKNPRYIRLIKR